MLAVRASPASSETGSAFGVQARFASEQVTFSGTATEFVRTGDSGGMRPSASVRRAARPCSGSSTVYLASSRSPLVRSQIRASWRRGCRSTRFAAMPGRSRRTSTSNAWTDRLRDHASVEETGWAAEGRRRGDPSPSCSTPSATATRRTPRGGGPRLLGRPDSPAVRSPAHTRHCAHGIVVRISRTAGTSEWTFTRRSGVSPPPALLWRRALPAVRAPC